jgi:hypothetical protein
LTGDLTCLSPHTVKVLFLGTLTVVIVAVVAISVIVHLVHFKRNHHKEQLLIKVDNSNVGNILMSLRHPSSKIVTDDMLINSSIMSSLAWNENMVHNSSSSTMNLTEKDRQQYQLQPIVDNGGHYNMSISGARYQPQHQEPLCFIDLNSSTPCQCNYSYPYSNWS